MTGALTETDPRPEAMDRSADRFPFVASMVVVLAVAAVLRLYGLGDDSLWDNEILSLQRATVDPADAYDLLREGTHPPMYSQVVLRTVFAFGEGELSQRLPSAVFGTVTVWLVYLLGSSTFERRVGLAAAGLLAVLPLHVYYSREGRMYALLALLVTLWIGSLLRAHRTDSIAMWAAYALLGSATIYTHYFAGLTVLVVFLTTAALYVSSDVDATRRRRWLVSSATIGLLFLPWLPTFVHQFQTSASGLPGGPVTRLPRFITQFFTAFADVHGLARVAIVMALIILAVPVGTALWRSIRDRDDQMFPLSILVAAGIGTIVLAAIGSAAKPILFTRYFVGILPVCCILLSVGAFRSRSRAVGWAAFGTLGMVSLFGTAAILTESWRPEFESAMERIAAEGPDGAVMLVAGGGQSDLRLTELGQGGLEHYRDPMIPVVPVAANDPLADLDATVGEVGAEIDRIWLLQYRSVPDVDVPSGYEVVIDQRYDSRFFSTPFPIRLTLLETAD